MAIFFAELFGTFLLILLGNGVTANMILPKSKGENGGWIVIATGWGFAVMFSVYLVGWISGAHINPAVTIAMLLAGKIEISNLIVYFLGQFLGAYLGALTVYAFYYNHFQAEKAAEFKLMSFCTKPVFSNQKINFLCEAIGTFVLIVGIFSIGDSHNQISSSASPFLVGALVWAIGMSLGGTTGYAINPARDLGPRLAHASVQFKGKGSNEWSYSWVPFFGPILGAIFGYLFYFHFFLKVVSY